MVKKSRARRTSKSKTILASSMAAMTMLVAGCSGGPSGNEDVAYVARDVESLYSEAKRRLDRGNTALAAGLFDEVERQHPYSPWARRAQLMRATKTRLTPII